MPRAKPPGPFTAAADVHRVSFAFDIERRRPLINQLARDLQAPTAGAVIASSIAKVERQTPKQVAGQIVDRAEEQIILLRSAQEDDTKTTPASTASIGKAIDDLKKAMEPFLKGWVDSGTAGIADWHAIDAALARREAALKAMPRRKPDEAARFNANVILVNAHQTARAAGFELSEDAAYRFTAAALVAAEVNHPDIYEHPARFRAWLDNGEDETADAQIGS